MSANSPFPMMISIVVLDTQQLSSVYALLGGASPVAVAPAPKPSPTPVVETSMTVEPEEPVADVDDGAPDVDAHGWPWSADLHASTKGTTKDGLWRMKIGVTRPSPKPGFPKATGTEPEIASTSVSEPTVIEAEPAPETIEEDDEFAAFRAAAEKADAEDVAVKASVPARKWTDADLGALCNQAATKLGNPVPVKEVIAQFIPEGTVAHSRNIPEDQRAAFAAAVEAKAGIEFAG